MTFESITIILEYFHIRNSKPISKFLIRDWFRLTQSQLIWIINLISYNDSSSESKVLCVHRLLYMCAHSSINQDKRCHIFAFIEELVIWKIFLFVWFAAILVWFGIMKFTHYWVTIMYMPVVSNMSLYFSTVQEFRFKWIWRQNPHGNSVCYGA